MSAQKVTEAMAPSLEQEDFGFTNYGTKVDRYLLRHGDLEIAVITWGAVVQSIRVPDRTGHVADVALGYDGLEGYLSDSAYFGAVVGRYANRIARGRFTLDGVEYQVPCNDRGNALHGGPEGFNRQVWSARTTHAPDKVAVELTHLSPDGAMGFPGNGTIESHVLSVPASRYLPVDAEGIPLGAAAPVQGTALDFLRAKPVGRDPAARVEEPATGRSLEPFTDQPAVQFYSGNLLDGSPVGKGQRTYRQSDGLCLETQHPPDSPNTDSYPSVVLRPGERWKSTTMWRFGA